jgi:ribose transport system substrate-binding protein
MERTFVLLLGTLLFFSMSLIGCGGKKTGTAAGDGSETAAGVKKVKIGVAIWSTDDGLGADAKAAVDAASRALGFDVVYRTGDYDAESQITAFENFIAADCDGIMVVTMVDTSTDELLKICEEAEIPLQVMFRNIVDKETYDKCMNSKYFLGYVVENENKAGADMVDALVKEGCSTFGLLYREAGNGVTDRRQTGINDRLAELGSSVMAYTATLSSTATATEVADAAAQLKTAYPKIDAFICTSGSNGSVDSVITFLNNTPVKLASFDTPVDIQGGFAQGNLSILTVGAQIDPFFAVINLWCFLQGKPLSNKPVEIQSNYIYLTSAGDAKTYEQYFKQFNTYTAEEIKQLTAVYNPDMNLDRYVKEVSGYSLESVVRRINSR